MKFLYATIIAFTALLITSSITTSYGFENYDPLDTWGQYGFSEPGHFVNPQYVAVGEDGSVYVTDFGNKRIQKFSSNGEYLTHWGNSGKQLGDFYNPSGIAVSDDSVFVVDRDLNRIQKFSLDGEFIKTWGKKGTSDGQFFYPNGITVSNNLLYVVDTGNQRIQIFSTDGDFVSSFGSSGLDPGQFLNVVGISSDVDGNIFVTDKGNNKIEKFNADGELLTSFSFYFPSYVFAPESIVISPFGDIFVVNSADDRILHLNENSDLRLNQFAQNGPYPDTFENISGLAIGINGELLVLDSKTHAIQLFETEFFEQPAESYYVAPVEVRPPHRDQTKPEITAPDSIVVEAEDVQTDVSIGIATATDASGIKTIINNAPEGFKPGITNVIWIAFDNAGHSATDYQRITVNTCGHNPSTYNLIEGTSGDDVISGTDGDDLIFGMGGNDLISGGLGNDCIFGGSGDDIISGNEGDDTIKGNSGHDILKGNSGNDLIYANSGSDVMDGGESFDRCHVDSDKDLTLNCEE
ncbi:6-bladed beta-propeller [Nitrosopumilus sp.]|uniref:6-bladed beta-propeller n=1 Tax=Nitrosopumilus sp. TaxID=2024843 RepID=UPI00247D2BD5|nr:6-bladed beta-propeller [Nitrosopumilus sp.]MCV0431286.1 6-bladed beta-propeller [Nitrosopumilus sp.]